MFTLPQLAYSYDALEPHIDTLTMQIHHGKHHDAYVTKLNEAVAKFPELGNHSIEDLLKGLSNVPESGRQAIRNNGGGHWNHTFFWELLNPEPTSIEQATKLHDKISQYFGDFFSFKEQMKAAGLARFGSGWVWLIELSDGSLKIVSTPNQDNPLMDIAETQGKPILAIDVWEHAYYLKHQSKRADYLDAIWNVIDFAKAESHLS